MTTPSCSKVRKRRLGQKWVGERVGRRRTCRRPRWAQGSKRRRRGCIAGSWPPPGAEGHARSRSEEELGIIDKNFIKLRCSISFVIRSQRDAGKRDGVCVGIPSVPCLHRMTIHPNLAVPAVSLIPAAWCGPTALQVKCGPPIVIRSVLHRSVAFLAFLFHFPRLLTSKHLCDPVRTCVLRIHA